MVKVDLTPQQIAAGWTPERLKAHLDECERRLSARIDAVFDRRPPLRLERTQSGFDWLRKGSAHAWWRNGR